MSVQDYWTDTQDHTTSVSDDDGRTWRNGSTTFACLGVACALQDITFVDGEVGYAALHDWATGRGGTFWRTDDGGETWQVEASPTGARLVAAAAGGAALGAVSGRRRHADLVTTHAPAPRVADRCV